MQKELSRLTNKLYAATVENQESIAKRISAPTPDKYIQMFAEEIAKQKLRSVLGIDSLLIIPKTIEILDDTYLVEVAGKQLLPDMHKSSLLEYVKITKREFARHEASGIIVFLPFSMNDTTARKILERNLEIGLVDMNYTERSLERRIALYVNS